MITYNPNDMHTGSFHMIQSMRMAISQTPNYLVYLFILVVLRSAHVRSYGVMAITLDFESNNPSSNLGRTFPFCQIISTVNIVQPTMSSLYFSSNSANPSRNSVKDYVTRYDSYLWFTTREIQILLITTG